jgi:hypothetical protein
MQAEQSGRPGSGGVAVRALLAEETQVNLWLGVAGAAFLGCIPEHLAGVTGLAVQSGVGSIQKEEIVMVIIAQPVHPIVAFQASGTKLLRMPGQKVRLLRVL